MRPIDGLSPDFLGHELAVHRSHLERLFEKAHSRTDNLEREAKTALPGEILFALANEFDINIPDDEVREVRNVRQMVEGVARLVAAKASGAGTPLGPADAAAGQ